jgi:O-antigen ligase/tetratricopeptide (TPR) repeat protein
MRQNNGGDTAPRGLRQFFSSTRDARLVLAKLPLFLLAFVPLIVDNLELFPCIAGKTLAIRLGVTLAFVLYAGALAGSVAFRTEAAARLRVLLRSRVVLCLGAYLGLLSVSTVFAVDSYRAFWGNVERGEGFAGFVFFFGFFILALLLFEHADWLRFFKLSLITGVLLFVLEMVQYAHHVDRPPSQTGNPIFLAAYYLFVLFSAMVILFDLRRSIRSGAGMSLAARIWLVLAWMTLPASIVGIFITESRGVILGMAAGGLAAAAHAAWRGRVLPVRRANRLRIVALLSGGTFLLLGALLFVTRDSAFWKDLPGFRRLTSASSVEERFLYWDVALRAMSPTRTSLGRTLVGYGPDNFMMAYDAHFAPRAFQLDASWVDHAHNTLLDVLVMNGLLGLGVYLALWASLAWLLVRKKVGAAEGSAVAFFGVSYFFQDLTVFSSVTTYIPLFAFFAFAVFLSLEGAETNWPAARPAGPSGAPGGTPALANLLAVSVAALSIVCAVLLGYTLLGYRQMALAVTLLNSGDASKVVREIDGALSPFTYVQNTVRPVLLRVAAQYRLGDPGMLPLAKRAGAAMEDLTVREPDDVRAKVMLALFYDKVGQEVQDSGFYHLAEKQLLAAMVLVPKRQDILWTLAFTLGFQGRFEDASRLLDETVALDPLAPGPHNNYALFITTFRQMQLYPKALEEMEMGASLSGPAGMSTEQKAAVLVELMNHFSKAGDPVRLERAARLFKELKPAAPPAGKPVPWKSRWIFWGWGLQEGPPRA